MTDQATELAEHVERLLDAALEQTFPASDPVAVDVPSRTEAVLTRYRCSPTTVA